MSSPPENNNSNNKPKLSNSLKYGLISQPKSNINPSEIINSYLEVVKPEKYIKKDEFHYEFSISSFSQLTISINNLRKIQNIIEKYSRFDFLIIFIDIQNTNCIDFLEKSVDTFIDAGESSYIMKKCYIFGFFQDDDKKAVPEEKITTIIDAKGLEYFYFQMKNDDIEKFRKIMEKIIGESNTILVEKFLDQKHSELVLDNSNSKCSIY